MSEGLRLLSNLGAEEGPDWRRLSREPRVRAAAVLWGRLFGTGARLEPQSSMDPPEAPAAPQWPPELATDGEAPALACLPRDGRQAWLLTEEARAWGAPGDPEATARVHDKAFAVGFAATEGFEPRALRGLARCLDPAALADPRAARALLAEALEAWPAGARDRFTLKPRWGSSGRGRVAGDASRLDDPAWLEGLARLARRRGAVLEPWLQRVEDLSTQLWIGDQGPLQLLGTLRAWVSASGVPRGHRGGIDSRGRIFSHSRHEEEAREAAAALGAAARRAGHRGPLGVDAFSFLDESGTSRLRPVVEANARYTLGLAALGLVRRALPWLKADLGLAPGERRSFLVGLQAPGEAGGDGWEGARRRAGSEARLLRLPALGGPEGPVDAALLVAPEDGAIDAALGSS